MKKTSPMASCTAAPAVKGSRGNGGGGVGGDVGGWREGKLRSNPDAREIDCVDDGAAVFLMRSAPRRRPIFFGVNVRSTVHPLGEAIVPMQVEEVTAKSSPITP